MGKLQKPKLPPPHLLICVSICRDDCLNRNGGIDGNVCTCDDQSDSDTYFDTMRSNRSQDEDACSHGSDGQDDEDICDAESVELNFEDNAAINDDDCANQDTLCSNNSSSADACSVASHDVRTADEDCASQGDNLERKEDVCAESECDDSVVDERANTGTMGDLERCEVDGWNSACTDGTVATNNGTVRKTYSSAESESEDCGLTENRRICSEQTNTGTLQSECSCQDNDDRDSCMGTGTQTVKCANCANAQDTNTMRSNASAYSVEDCSNRYLNSKNTENRMCTFSSAESSMQNTMCRRSSAESAQCCCAGDTGTLQSERNQGFGTMRCAYCDNQNSNAGTMRSGYSCASTAGSEGCDANALCEACANQANTVNSNYSESTVRSNSFECLSGGNGATNTWGNTNTYRSGYSCCSAASSNRNGSCLVCMGTGTVRSKSAYTDTMDSSYSQQYGNCCRDSTMQSARSGYTNAQTAYSTRAGIMRSQESDSLDSEGDAEVTSPCFNICSCLGQNLIQLQLR